MLKRNESFSNYIKKKLNYMFSVRETKKCKNIKLTMKKIYTTNKIINKGNLTQNQVF